MAGKFHRVFAGALTLLVISACATSNPGAPDEATLDRMLGAAFGSSGTAFSPDGRLVAIGTREKVWVADTGTGQVLASLTDIPASTYSYTAQFGGKKSLAFMDSRRLIVGAQGLIAVWDVVENRVTHKHWIQGQLYSARAIAWSEPAKLLAYSSARSKSPVRVVPLGDKGFGKARNLPGFEGVPTDLVFSRDGRFLAAAGDGEGVSIREVETGELVAEIPTEGLVNDLGLFGENELLVAGANIAFWTFLDRSEMPDIENPDLQGQVTSQRLVKTAGVIALGTLALFEAMIAGLAGSGPSSNIAGAAIDLAITPTEKSQQPWCGRSTAISPDGSMLADIYPGITREVIRVYFLDSERKPKRINPSGEYSCAVQFSPDGKQLLITSNKVVRIYETETWKYHDLKLN